MKRNKRDENMPIGSLKKITDFLPPPEELAVPEETIKVTLSLKKASVEFFKQKARQCHTKYQKMLRELVDKYVEQYT